MEEKENKSQVKYVLLLLIVIVISLVGILIYLLIKPRLAGNLMDQNSEVTTVRIDDTIPGDVIIQNETSDQIQTDQTGDTTNAQADKNAAYKTQIDEDLTSLDLLDLSSPENDLGEDKIEEL